MIWNIKTDNNINLSNLMDTLLDNRGIKKESLKKYSIKDLYDPYLIWDMDKCVERLRSAIFNKEKIYIHGDFDVDGTAATAILWSYLYRTHHADVLPYIPHRVDEGYGMSKKTIDKLIKEGAKLIISVDCGIKDIELVEYAKTQGIDIIISDHHEFVRDEENMAVLPDTIVIHGMHPKGSLPQVICGGATSWKIVCALEKSFRGNSFTDNSMQYLDLAAITTLTDIMPLKDENRIIVSLGLEQMKKTRRVGIDELCNISKIEPQSLEAYHIGFMIGPRLNAPGRVENSAINSLRILCTENRTKAIELANLLDSLNKKRQFMTEKYMEQVNLQLDLNDDGTIKSNVIVASGIDWPEGIVGLVAGKIAEKYYRPTFVMSYNTKENKVTGSARSIKSFHLVKALDECSEFLTRFGGHYMAAGYSLTQENIEPLKNALNNIADKILKKEDLIPELNIDCILDKDTINLNSVSQIQSLAPFGYGNTTPVFVSKNAKVIAIKYMGNLSQHIKISFDINGLVVDGIVFNAQDIWKSLKENSFYEIAYNLDINEWNGKKSVQLQLKDIK